MTSTSTSSTTSTVLFETDMIPIMEKSEEMLHLLNQYTREIHDMMQKPSQDEDESTLSQIMQSELDKPMSKIHTKIRHISQVGDDLIHSWHNITNNNKLENTTRNNDSAVNDSQTNISDFRSVYMNLVTDAFSDELDALRSNSNNITSNEIPSQNSISKASKKRKKKETSTETFHAIDSNHTSMKEPVIDINVLVDCLESGMNVFTKEERELVMGSSINEA